MDWKAVIDSTIQDFKGLISGKIPKRSVGEILILGGLLVEKPYQIENWVSIPKLLKVGCYDTDFVFNSIFNSFNCLLPGLVEVV